MRDRRLALALWITFAFVTWNVVFDRGVADAAVEFTRAQIVRSQQGASLDSIESAFSPRVRQAAVKADLYAAFVLLSGALVSRFLHPRDRSEGRWSRDRRT